MANLTDTAASWEAGIYQIETVDPVIGGAPNPATGAGMSNIPHLQLARRTVWLKAQVEALQADLAALDIDDITGLRQALGSFGGGATATVGATLTNSDVGRCYVFSGTSPATITLPSITGVPSGGVITIHNTGTAAVTVDANGSQQIDVGAVSVDNIIVNPAQTVTLARVQGSSLWHLLDPERSIGFGQTWQDFTGSRANGTAYQNTTGRPIEVNISVLGNAVTGGTPMLEVSPNGSSWITIAERSDAAVNNASAIIPAGWYYRVVNATTIKVWAELR